MSSELFMASLGEYFEEQTVEMKTEEKLPVYVVCRRGNDSQRAVKILQSKFSDLSVTFQDIQGGLHGWAKEVEKDFPVY
jgi:adenylyltransferase/sulfurtransferase